MEDNKNLLEKLANCIRFLSIDAVQKANSGHPGMPMGMADIATVLFKYFLKFDPNDPKWPDRDRFILSNGHGSMLLYSCLYLSGYKNINIEQIKNFRQLNSITAGHPEYCLEDGIETTTGPLSQGFGNAVGMAISEKRMRTIFSEKLVNHFTYVFLGDGCLMEGLSHESASLAGHLNLNKLIVFYDNNSISIDGPTSLSISDDHVKRFESQGWNTIKIDGHNFQEIINAIENAQISKKPTLISCKTKIGFGSPNKENTAASHGSPLGEEEIILTRKKLNWEHGPFIIPDNLMSEWSNFYKRNLKSKKTWENNLENSNLKEIFLNSINKNMFDNDIENKIIHFKQSQINNAKDCATRKASESTLEFLNNETNMLIGGSADLTGSNNTKTKTMVTINKNKFDGNYIYYGVREHAMASIMNGIALHKGAIPYGGTFLVFTDYCRPSIRLAALMKLQVIYVMTHDSIGLGEDGPTHQPIEHLSSLRAIPNLNVYRPADIIETIESWQMALYTKENPSVLVLTRQNLPLVRKSNLDKNMVSKGAYIIKDFKEYDATIFATGSEVSIALDASNILEKKNINVRVVSMACWELFENQDNNYKNEVLGNKNSYAIEAASSMGWSKFVKEKNFIGMNSFGASGPYKNLYQYFKITTENLVELILKNQ